MKHIANIGKNSFKEVFGVKMKELVEKINNMGGRFHAYCYRNTEQTQLMKHASKECYIAWDTNTGDLASDDIQEFLALLKLADNSLYEKFSKILNISIDENSPSFTSGEIIENAKLFAIANSKPQPTCHGEFTAHEALGVLQHEIGLTTANSEKPILGTYSAGPCVIVAMYNPKTKVAALAHVDCTTDLNSLYSHLCNILGNDTAIDIHIAGGDSTSESTVVSILKMINQNPRFILKTARILGRDIKSLAIDSRTGEIFTDFHHEQLDKGANVNMRMQFAALMVNDPLYVIVSKRIPTAESLNVFSALRMRQQPSVKVRASDIHRDPETKSLLDEAGKNITRHPKTR